MKDFFKFLKGHKAIAITLVAIVVVVLYIAYKKNNAGGQAATTADSSTLPTTNAQGSYYGMGEPTVEPIIITGTSAGVNGSSASGGSGSAPGPISTTPSGGATIPSTDPTQPDGHYVNSPTQYIARLQMGSAAGGPNIRSAPSGTASIVGHEAFGGGFAATGPDVLGTSNNPATPGVANTNQWIPVQGGYVSAADASQKPATIQQQNYQSQTATG